MARIAGVDLPANKRVEIALTYIYGIGRPKAHTILDHAKVGYGTMVRDLTEDEIGRIGAQRFEARDRQPDHAADVQPVDRRTAEAAQRQVVDAGLEAAPA